MLMASQRAQDNCMNLVNKFANCYGDLMSFFLGEHEARIKAEATIRDLQYEIEDLKRRVNDLERGYEDH